MDRLALEFLKLSNHSKKNRFANPLLQKRFKKKFRKTEPSIVRRVSKLVKPPRKAFNEERPPI